MSQWFMIQFTTETPDAAEQFIHDYVLDAIDRVSELEACETISFAPSMNPETGDRSAVIFGGTGDPDEVINYEGERWDSHVEDGVITQWEQTMLWDEDEMSEMLGEKGAALSLHLSELSAKMAKLAFEKFDELDTVPAAVDTHPDENPVAGPSGWWQVLHTTTVQLNYSLDDELDAYRYGIEHTLRNFAEYEGAAAAEKRVDELLVELERMREEVKEGRRET